MARVPIAVPDQQTAAAVRQYAPSLPFRPLLAWFGLPLALSTFAFEPLRRVLFIVIMSSPGASLTSAAIAVQSAAVSTLFFVGAQATLLSLCLAWSPGKLWHRLALYCCIFGACVLCWLAGSLVSPAITEFYARQNPQSMFWSGSNGFFSREAMWRSLRQIVSVSPMILLGVQFPFWGTRVLFGWKLIHPHQEADRSPESLSIKDLLAATACVAVCLGLLQLAGAGDDVDTPAVPQSVYFFGAVMASAVLAMFLFIGVLPITFLFLRMYSRFWSWWVTLVFAAATASVVVLIERLQSTNTIDWRQILNGVVPMYAYFITLAAGLQLLSVRGWQLAKRTA